jgi:hypothetical protein
MTDDCCGGVAKLAHGVIGLAKAAVGADPVSDATLLMRRDICRECDRATRNPTRVHLPTKGLTSFSRCTACDCVIAAKSRLASERCPLGKW